VSTVFFTILGIIFGLLLGVGVYEFLVQAGSVDPNRKIGLIFPVVGVLLGVALGIFGGRRKKGTS
jgi:hypothetical protein